MAKLKRNRRIKTCEYCYNHKLKCDRNLPCATCVRTKSKCIYEFKNLPEPNCKEQATSSPLNSSGSVEPVKVVFGSSFNGTALYYSRAFFPYLEPSLNRMVLFKLSEVGESSKSQYDYSHPGSFDFQRLGLDVSLESIVSEYPKKEEIDAIFYLYWDYVHPLIPVVDKENTIYLYTKFWQNLNKKENPKFDVDSAVLFLSMLFAIKTALEVDEKNPEKLAIIKKDKIKIHNLFQRFKLIFGSKTNPNLAYIQASIIFLQSGSMYYMGIFTYTACLSRQAEYMGLHRDPLVHNVLPAQKNSKDIQIRRIVWHYTRSLDTAASTVSGLSPHMIMTNASSKFPLKRDFNPESGDFDGDLNPFMLFTIGRFKCTLVMETISHYLNSDFVVDSEKLLRWEGLARTVVALYKDISILVEEIFSCSNNSKYSKDLLRWLVSNIAVLVHRTYLLHRACDRRPYSHHNRVILKPANAAHIGLAKLGKANTSKKFFEKILAINIPYQESTIEVSMLVLYETKFRVSSLPEITKFRWFIKNSNPFQYVYFVIRDIFNYPNKIYQFNHIPKEIKNFVFENELLNYPGDVRRYTVDIAIEYLNELKGYWSEPIIDMMEFLELLRTYVYKTCDSNNGIYQTDKGSDNNINSIIEEKFQPLFDIMTSFNANINSVVENPMTGDGNISNDTLGNTNQINDNIGVNYPQQQQQQSTYEQLQPNPYPQSQFQHPYNSQVQIDDSHNRGIQHLREISPITNMSPHPNQTQQYPTQIYQIPPIQLNQPIMQSQHIPPTNYMRPLPHIGENPGMIYTNPIPQNSPMVNSLIGQNSPAVNNNVDNMMPNAENPQLHRNIPS